MKTAFKSSFSKDLKKHINNKSLLSHIKETILQIETADTITSIPNLKKLKAEGNYYRIRAGNYRLGLIIEDNVVTFVRLLNRKDIYRYFP